MNKIQEIDYTLQCNVDRAKLLIVKVNDSIDGRYLNIKIDLDGHVVRKRRALSKLADQLGCYSDAIEHVIAEVLLTECGLTKRQLGETVTVLADGSMYCEGITMAFELIPMSCAWDEDTIDRDRIQPYRVIAYFDNEWQVISRHRSSEKATYYMLKNCHKFDRLRVMTQWSLDGSYLCDEIIMAAVERDNDGCQWYASGAFGVCSVEQFSTWHKTHC